jgi:hypothetical protein
MINKTQQIKTLIAAGEHKTALHIVAKFQRLHMAGDFDKIKTASECIKYPNFYKALKYDINKLINDGIAELINIFK